MGMKPLTLPAHSGPQGTARGGPVSRGLRGVEKGGARDPYVTEGWLEEPAGKGDENYLQGFVVNEKGGWTAE